jgi:hypothetical protein
MIEIRNTLVSIDVVEKCFKCNLDACKGFCCIDGDSGAPLEKHELKELEDAYPKVKPYLSKEGIAEIEKQGTWVVDSDGDDVTPLVKNSECAYVIFENELAVCAIERAWSENKISFQKPISCHLYPIRVKKYKDYEGINYDQRTICKHARTLGAQEVLYVYEFLKEPLIRKYGVEWYNELLQAVDYMKKTNDEENVIF